ncbi:MAG: threonine--tRNA ligase [Candidatus Aenigmatarchaeota archaeon]
MKIITMHSNSLEIEPKKKAIKDAEKVEKKKLSFKECLVVFSAVEKRDESAVVLTIQNTAEEVKKIAEEVKTKNIVLYPYVHLTNEPSSSDAAMKVLFGIEKALKKDNYKVEHAPFGWYKAFSISVKGHPLSELSREIVSIPGVAKAEEEISGALKDEEKIKSEWFIMAPDGKIVPAKEFDFKGFDNLKKFYSYESEKKRAAEKMPPHVKYMRALELVDHESGSDPGNLRFFPKGRLIKSLLEEWVTQKTVKYGAMEVETPIMYDYEHPALKSYLHRFPARQYVVESFKKRFFLRFSACFGQFLMKHGMTISYRNLPLKMYELTRYSFRLEKPGELSGLRRLRAFTMPDMHTLCKDLKQANEEFENQFEFCMGLMEDLGFKPGEYETAVRFSKDLWKQKDNQKMAQRLAQKVNSPLLIEIWSKRFAYFDPKFEFNFVDSLNKASALSTVQIDHENAERYKVMYTAENNKRKYPLILHCSPSGAIERCMYAILEKAAMMKNPMLPLWLSPIQVRLCPLNDDFIDYCKDIAKEISAQDIRIDIDDRAESVQKKVRDAEKEWVPLIIVVGKKEKDSGKLAVRFRENGEVKNMLSKEVVNYVKERSKGKPFKPLPLPPLMSKRPAFL